MVCEERTARLAALRMVGAKDANAQEGVDRPASTVRGPVASWSSDRRGLGPLSFWRWVKSNH